MLLVNFSLWKDTTFCIHCSPVEGESGWMYIRFGISGSAFPATIHRLDTKTIDSASGLHIKHRKDRQVVRCALWDVTPWTRVVKFVPFVRCKDIWRDGSTAPMFLNAGGRRSWLVTFSPGSFNSVSRSVNKCLFYQTSRCHIPENNNLSSHLRKVPGSRNTGAYRFPRITK